MIVTNGQAVMDEQVRRRAELYPELVAALEDLYRNIDATSNIGWDEETHEALDNARAVLEKARSAR